MSWVEDKVRDLGRKIDDKIIQPVLDSPATIATIGLNFLVPGLGAAIGTTLGATGAAASIVGGAVIGGAASGLTGGNVLKGAAGGAVSAGIGQAFKALSGGTAGTDFNNPTVQTWDDGSSIQYFDDGSQLVIDSTGAVSAVEAPLQNLNIPVGTSPDMYDMTPVPDLPMGPPAPMTGSPDLYEPVTNYETPNTAWGSPEMYETAVNAPTPGTAWGSPEMYDTEFTPTAQTGTPLSLWDRIKLGASDITAKDLLKAGAGAASLIGGAMKPPGMTGMGGAGGGGSGGGTGQDNSGIVGRSTPVPYSFIQPTALQLPMQTTRQLFGPMGIQTRRGISE